MRWLLVLILVLAFPVWAVAQLSPEEVLNRANAAQLAAQPNPYMRMTYLNGVAQKLWFAETRAIKTDKTLSPAEKHRAIIDLNKTYIDTLNRHGKDFREAMQPVPPVRGVVDRILGRNSR